MPRAPRLDWGQNPAKYAAHQAVKKAVKRGDLIRPDSCECCGVEGNTVAHHDDYSKPLEVRWLIRRCHRLYHFAQDVAARTVAA